MSGQPISKSVILVVVTRHYLKSQNFNGISTTQIVEALKTPWENIVEPLKALVLGEKIGVLGEGTDIDTHMLRIGFPSTELQLAHLDRPPCADTCIYPRLKHLAKVVKPEAYTDRPYRLALALGEPQLAYRAFDLSILEAYRRNPRYRYWNNDVGGQIRIVGERNGDSAASDGDPLLLPSFGLAYDASMNRAIAVCLRYLGGLTAKHQQLWKSKELKAKHELTHDYLGTVMSGNPPEGASIFAATIAEIKLINQLAQAMGRSELFREQFEPDDEIRSREFTFLVRPTPEDFTRFVHTLDNLLSESVNRDFFQDDIRSETQSLRSDGSTIGHRKGALEMLVDWGTRTFPPSHVDRWLQACRALRKVRALRQMPEQRIGADIFDQAFIKKQRDLMIVVYKSLRDMREMLSRLPGASDARLSIPPWMRNGRIWAV